MSYSNSFPQQRPTLNLDFANSGKLDSRISFSRADTPPTYAAPSAVHYWSNEKHLSSENLLPYSNDLSGWSSSTTTTPSTNNLAPDGTNTATAVIENTATSGHNRYTSFSSVSGTNYTFLTFAKANGRTQFQVVAQATTSIANVKFDLTAVTSTVTSGSAVSHNITAIGSAGWYKCEVTVTATGTGNNAYHQVNFLDATGASSYTGDGVSGLYLWGMQVASTGETVLNETSGSIHREYSSTLKSVSNAGDPRFEYDPTDGQSVGTPKGLLVESQSSNLAIYSDDVSNWGGSTGIISGAQANACVGPTGSMAYAIVEPTIANTHYASINVSGQDYSAAYTASVYIKKLASGSGTKQVKLRINGMGGQAYAAFDLDSGAVVQEAGTTFNSATISSVSNGWYRISMTYTNQAADRATGMLLVLSNGDSASLPNYTGDGYTAYGVANFQFEKSSFPSSPISTSGASATRAADSCSVVDATLFSSGEHTIIWEGDTDPTSSDKRFFALSDGSMSNRFVADYDNGVATRLRNWADGATNVNMSTSTVDMTVGTHKLAATLKTNESQLVIDGTRRQVDTSCVVGSGIDQLAINSSTTGAGTVYNMNGHCKRITYFNVALSQTEAEALTSNP